jgi:hypothetical protein
VPLTEEKTLKAPGLSATIAHDTVEAPELAVMQTFCSVPHDQRNHAIQEDDATLAFRTAGLEGRSPQSTGTRIRRCRVRMLLDELDRFHTTLTAFDAV